MPFALARTSHSINCQLMPCKKVTLSNQNERYKRCCIRINHHDQRVRRLTEKSDDLQKRTEKDRKGPKRTEKDRKEPKRRSTFFFVIEGNYQIANYNKSINEKIFIYKSFLGFEILYCDRTT